MRNYQRLDTFEEKDGRLQLLTTEEVNWPVVVTFGREGTKIVIAVSIGPLEMAFRLDYDELQRRVARLKPVPGLATTQQVGSGQAHIGLGLTEQGQLVMRPSLVGDATGHLTFNLYTTEDVFKALYKWLDCDGL